MPSSCTSVKNLLVGNNNLVARSAGSGDNIAALINQVNDISTRGVDRTRTAGGTGIRESDGVKSRERSKRLGSTADDGEVLHDPLSVCLAEGALNLAGGEGVSDGLTVGLVGDGGNTAGCAGGLNAHLDGVTSRDVDAAEVVGIVGNPLVPGVVGHGAALDTEVETSLQEGALAGVSINTDPGTGAILGAVVTTAGDGRGGSNDASGDLGESGVNQDSTGPVSALVVVLLGQTSASQTGVRTADTMSVAAASHALGERRGNGRAGEEKGTGSGSKLHFG
ncbi:hypothetical protein EIK77_010137 [Talaromyces pinophilus]|nr:hypothetical protein EIK77_010137 [Talaromyces pinophilus]